MQNPAGTGRDSPDFSGLLAIVGAREYHIMAAGLEVHHLMVHFSGRVQGVGFRFTTLHLAREFEVAGYVRNLPDGRVLVEAEGAVDELNKFVTAIEEAMHGYIQKTERTAGRRPPQFRGFGVR